ncbi:MAG TPA: hypothetical protein VF113_10135 [Stellaceae bacterium]
MFSKITFAAALALVVSGLAGTAHAYDAFGGGDHETVIRQSAQSPAIHSMSKADDRFTVGSNAWTGDRDGLILAGASTGLGKNVVATNAR